VLVIVIVGFQEIAHPAVPETAFKNLNSSPDSDTINEFISIRPQLIALRDAGKLTPQQLNLLKRSDEILKYASPVASDNPIDIITHEMGHHLDNNLKKIAKEKGINEDELKEILKQALLESNEDVNKYNLSYYAFSDIFAQRAEVFAEAFTLFRLGKFSRLSPSFNKLFNLITK
jgi:hypothetical protein